jgi:hypothetical protein
MLLASLLLGTKEEFRAGKMSKKLILNFLGAFRI